ncbi:death-associated inhibitor of apoptosis 1-like [Euwallacea fornicatus]|uniref:death-associated inhibitor of apoptosis 1-like n=1 Tax=Euwallacea fornicatus TaxID=995702 RepID=UPI00338F6EB5
MSCVIVVPPLPTDRSRVLDLPDNGNKTTSSLTGSSLTASSLDFDSLDFRKYEDRLKSYVNWPNKNVSKETLAKAGFYYKNPSGHNDIVLCPYCHIEGYQWAEGDEPMEDHRSWNPNCPFVMSQEVNSSNTRNSDTCGLYGCEILPNSVPEDEIQLEKLGINKNKGPTHLDKFSLASRLKTFEVWPKSIKQTPHDLAEAGFFYVGVGDQTICFHCGGGLKDWEQDDNPWEEHALWFPKCSYLFLKKGQDYINTVKQKRDPRFATATPSTSEAKESPKPKEVVIKNCDSDEESQGDVKTLCKICLQQEVGVVFLPCGHIVSCVECSSALKSCPVCRKPLEATVRAFLS